MAGDTRPVWCPTDTLEMAYTHEAVTWDELLELGQHSVWMLNLLTGETQHLTDGAVADWSPDGQYLLIVREPVGALLRDVDTGDETMLPVFCGPICFSPCGEEIAFFAEGDQMGVWILNLESLVSEWIAPRYLCDWSHDCQRILCDSLITIARDGSRLGKIPLGPGPGGWASTARWSPDGNTIAFVGHCPEDSQKAAIWVINADGRGLRAVTWPGAGPSWSPDSRHLAFVAASTEGPVSALWVVDPDGSDRRQLTFPKP